MEILMFFNHISHKKIINGAAIEVHKELESGLTLCLYKTYATYVVKENFNYMEVLI